MRLFSGIFGIAVLVLVLCFAFSNLEAVAVALWPFEGSVQAPLYLVGLVPLAIGLIGGAFLGWLGSLSYKFRAQKLQRELTALNARIVELQKPAAAPQAKRHFWQRGA